MIIRCPECSTGFELPDERVTPEGTKLKCSKCEHIFRVRDADGEPEIFYKDRDREKNKENSGADDSNPFPNAGMDLKPKKKSAFGDLDADEDEMEAFQSAFDEQQDDDLDATASSPATDSGAGGQAVATATAEEQQQEQPQQQRDQQPEQQEEVALSTGSSGKFGDPKDHVDPSFGEGGAYFDPDEGKVDETSSSSGQSSASSPAPASGPANAAGGPPTSASGPPPTAQPANTSQKPPSNASSGPAPSTGGPPSSNGHSSAPPSSGPEPSPQVQEASASDEWDEDDFEPHKIGGGAGQKLVTFLLLVSLVFGGLLGSVAYLNDGFIDFRAVPEMLEVAFADGEYEPRDEWRMAGPETRVVEASEPVEVEGVHAELVSIGGDDAFVVQGIVRNHEDERVYNIDLRAMIMTPDERSMRDIRVPMGGGDLAIGDFRQLQNSADIDDLFSGEDVVLEPGDARAFTLVFDDVPERVQQGEHFTYRVEIADHDQG